MTTGVGGDDLSKTLERFRKDAAEGGYHLNPDEPFTRSLLEGILINEGRYEYPACPCRLATGRKEEDLDIICPCDYRDQDLVEYGACYCGLYVGEAVHEGLVRAAPVPERRPSRSDRKAKKTVRVGDGPITGLAYPVWRCRVCGYLCARDKPPGICPVCKAKADRFERFM